MRGNRFAALTQFTQSFLDTVVAVQRLPVGHSAVTFLPQIWQVLVKGGPEGYDLEQHRLFAYAEEQIVREGAEHTPENENECYLSESETIRIRRPES